MAEVSCPRCSSTEFSKALDKSNKHYCSKCQNIWVPGLAGMNRIDITLAAFQKENVELKGEITKLRAELAAMKIRSEKMAETAAEKMNDQSKPVQLPHSKKKTLGIFS